MRFVLAVAALFFSVNAFSSIALISSYPEFRDFAGNQERLEKLSLMAIKDGAKTIVFSEGAIGGYGKTNEQKSYFLAIWCKSGMDSYAGRKCQDVNEIAQYPDRKEILNYWESFAQKNDIYLILQIPEGDEENYYNTAYVYGPKGFVNKYRKNTLYWTDQGYAIPGDQVTAIDLPHGKFGLMICADGHWNDVFKKYNDLGIKRYIALGYGIYPPRYSLFSRRYKMEGIFIDAQQYAGKFRTDGHTDLLELYNKQSYILYDDELNHMKTVSFEEEDKNHPLHEKRQLFYQFDQK